MLKSNLQNKPDSIRTKFGVCLPNLTQNTEIIALEIFLSGVAFTGKSTRCLLFPSRRLRDFFVSGSIQVSVLSFEVGKTAEDMRVNGPYCERAIVPAYEKRIQVSRIELFGSVFQFVFFCRLAQDNQ